MPIHTVHSPPDPPAAGRRALAAGGLALLLAACTSTGGGPATSTPSVPGSSPTPRPANACPDLPAQVPGWPVHGAVVGAAAELVPIPVSSELAVGENRFIFTLADAENHLIAAPDLAATAAFYDLAADPATPEATHEATFLWTLEGELGLYRTNVEFSCAGAWGMEVRVSRESEEPRTGRVVFDVRSKSRTPPIGKPAPASDTPTADDRDGIARISTDDDPDPAFYEASIAEAARGGRPAVIVFATPAFCRTRTCGPALDIVKEVASDYGERVTFVHVEPYELVFQDGALQPVVENGQLKTVPAAQEWGLPSEPYVFVLDARGRVAAKFEGVAGADELRDALDEVSRS